ncbi:hypothetical protein K461DRAFT_282091 [Myriangium duriaei CBS 260.36]|uniref:2EXR domain-containing protein n=1 Tax=Myriangium duriaei CBS 260.36 TaxID=1168546 RepID=A0A9P4MD77_9PEZI|nr:hypothetical protein K461DRAFT_282091 [Myriangium duriaei CBS 260.36]
MSPSFQLFSSLPPEVRNEVWSCALPMQRGPFLHFYEKGCWTVQIIERGDSNYSYQHPEQNIYQEFRHDQLDNARLNLHLLFVNKEARGIALSWIRQYTFERRLLPHKQYPVYIRHFNAESDALYVSDALYEQFIMESFDQGLSIGVAHQCRVFIKKIAISQRLLQKEVESFHEVWREWMPVRMLCIVVDPPAELDSPQDEVQQHWSFENTQGGSFSFTPTRNKFFFEGRRCPGDESIFSLMERTCAVLKDDLAESWCEFEIRPVFAIKI